jgi:hypothetical protein
MGDQTEDGDQRQRVEPQQGLGGSVDGRSEGVGESIEVVGMSMGQEKVATGAGSPKDAGESM